MSAREVFPEEPRIEERKIRTREKKGGDVGQVEVAPRRRRKRLGSVVERPMFWLQKHRQLKYRRPKFRKTMTVNRDVVSRNRLTAPAVLHLLRLKMERPDRSFHLPPSPMSMCRYAEQFVV